MVCLNKLEDRVRVVLQRCYAGVPINQLAEERGQSSAATKMYLFRVRQALKRCVEAHS
jgi:DNA-directed RNA polymerase specialized sigma24 family protein